MMIGLDVGTTGCKACLFSPEGEVKGYAFRECPIVCDEPAKAEQDAELVWNTVTAVLRETLASGGNAGVSAIAVSVQGDAVIPVDRDFRPLHPAILGMDYRSKGEADDLAALLGDRALFDLTGMRPHPMNSAVKMLWLRRNRPAVFEKAWKIVTYADYITGRLCGEAVIDHTMASRTMCFETESLLWNPRILDAVGMDSSRLSPPRPSGEIAGTIRPEVSAATGLPQTCQVVTGGHDQCCAALGAGVLGNGRAVLSSGTADVLSTAFASPRSRDALYEGYYPNYLYATKGLHFTFSLLHVGGILLKWYRDTLAAAETAQARDTGADPYELIIDGMGDEPSPVMVLPHFNGSGTPWCDMDSKGAIVGLTLSTTRHDIARAVLESLSFEQRINLERLDAAGARVDELYAVGGGARSARALQLRADVLGRTIMTPVVREAACLGAALLAGSATGVYNDIDQAVKATVRPAAIYRPDAGKQRTYDARFDAYRTLYASLKPVNAVLANHQPSGSRHAADK